MYSGTSRLGLDSEPHKDMATDEGMTGARLLGLFFMVCGAMGEDGGSGGTEGARDGDGVRGGGVDSDEADDVKEGVGDWEDDDFLVVDLLLVGSLVLPLLFLAPPDPPPLPFPGE